MQAMNNIVSHDVTLDVKNNVFANLIGCCKRRRRSTVCINTVYKLSARKYDRLDDFSTSDREKLI